jgi:hypothetical protein
MITALIELLLIPLCRRPVMFAGAEPVVVGDVRHLPQALRHVSTAPSIMGGCAPSRILLHK